MHLIQVLGTGCPNCNKMAENVEAAAKALGLEYEFEKVTNLGQILQFGVPATPALIVDGSLKVSGRVLSVAELKKVLAE